VIWICISAVIGGYLLIGIILFIIALAMDYGIDVFNKRYIKRYFKYSIYGYYLLGVLGILFSSSCFYMGRYR